MHKSSNNLGFTTDGGNALELGVQPSTVLEAGGESHLPLFLRCALQADRNSCGLALLRVSQEERQPEPYTQLPVICRRINSL